MPFIKERLKALPKKLLHSGADMIFLQEVYHIKHKDFLKKSLQNIYPFIYYSHHSFRFSLESGLVVLSKEKLDDIHFCQFKSKCLEEKLFAQAGFVSFIKDNSLFFNVHLTAGGLSGPESPKTEKIRELQIKELLTYSNKFELQRKFIIGDLNCGPEVSSQNYSYLLESGFNKSKNHLYTWDPENILNKNGIHAHCPKQSIDHILIQGLSNFETEICFTQADIDVENQKVTLSDHYGISLNL